MSNEKFTKGEWKVRTIKDTDFSHEINTDKGFFVIANISICDASKEEAKANANLIAASPDLLKGCRAAIAIFQSEGIDESHPIVGEVFSQITNAVSKAMS